MFGEMDDNNEWTGLVIGHNVEVVAVAAGCTDLWASVSVELGVEDVHCTAMTWVAHHGRWNLIWAPN